MLQSRDSEMKAYPSGCQELSGSVFLAGVDWVAFSKATGRLVLTCTNSAAALAPAQRPPRLTVTTRWGASWTINSRTGRRHTRQTSRDRGWWPM